MKLRQASTDDLPAILEIHNHAVRTLAAIWTPKEDTLEGRRNWMEGLQSKGFPIFIAQSMDGRVLGYGSYGPFRAKEGYRLTVEHSIYVRDEAQGRGLGRQLMQALIDHARAAGMHVMIACVDSENTGSIALHAKLGFREAGRLPQVGFKFGRWLDLVQMTLILDERPQPPVDT